jgi:electron transport complex protein RnfB
MTDKLVDIVNSVLPQTQCTRCGYPSCKEYAKALCDSEADINQCPPGGDEGIAKLAKILGKEVKELNPAHGTIAPKTIVKIIEDECIGCALCLKACPVDAIVGANKMIHTVIATECTGCDLCIPACPVDCIEIIADPDENWTQDRADHAKMRYENRKARKEILKKEQLELLQKHSKLINNL